MSKFDPIPRLQQIAATIEDGGHFDSPATAAHYINCAIKEIARLTAERDEARQRLCKVVGDNRDMWGEDVAKEYGWGCFDEARREAP